MSKVVVITGATNGIGEQSACQLAKLGHRMVLIARNKEKAAAVVSALPTPKNQKHTFYLANMASIEEIKRVANEISAAEPQIDILINNAGSHFDSYQETVDGLERTIAVNHLAYFVLTLGLESSLGKGSRIVNTASHLHRHTRFEPANLDLKEGNHHGVLNGFDNYSRSKLYNVLFSRHLSELWATNKGLTVNCHHPGLIRSGFGSGQMGYFEPLFWVILRVFGRNSEAGGDVITWLATSSDLEGITGQYYNRFRVETPSADAIDSNNASLLWEESRKWAGV